MDIDPEKFRESYWTKEELIVLCRKYGLSTSGAKSDITDRIYLFLTSGEKTKNIPPKIETWDSDREIDFDTPVRFYRNDLRTRKFFEKYIKNFRFNAYLRNFALTVPEGLTYGDLVEGWHEFEKQKKRSGMQIGKQFQYNQFVRDYYADESIENKSHDNAIKAWKEKKKRN